MKTAEEVAEEIVRQILSARAVSYSAHGPIIAQALTAYAESQAVAIANATISEACKDERAEALEDVRHDIGKMLDTFKLDPKIVAIAINIKKILDALKDKP